MSQKSQSCSLAGFSNRNVSFLYLNADCHLTEPVLTSCWARGHYCSMAVPAAVPGRWPGDSWSLPGWCSPCQYKGEGTTGKKQPVTILAPAASSGPTGPPGAEPPEMLGPDLSSHWGLCKYIPLISTAGPILCQSWKVKKQRLGRELLRGGEKAMIVDDEEHQWEQKSEQRLHRGGAGGDKALQ